MMIQCKNANYFKPGRRTAEYNMSTSIPAGVYVYQATGYKYRDVELTLKIKLSQRHGVD